VEAIMNRMVRSFVCAALVSLSAVSSAGTPLPSTAREVNEVPEPNPARTLAIVGAKLIDGRGGPPVPDSVVVVRGDRILARGAKDQVPIPSGAEIVDGTGLTLLPGLIDAHFHLDGNHTLPTTFLRNGVTSLRDPGAWIDAYAPVVSSPAPEPRLFLTGPHLDWPPPAYPNDSLLVLDPTEARIAVNRLVDGGASAIKVYFRLPVGMIRAVAEAAHARGVPVTAHLEIADARDAIRAGLDGVEHVTSFGTALVPLRQAEQVRQAVIADNQARRQRRYQLWSTISVSSPRADAVLDLLVERGVFFAPTLAVFERRAGDAGVTAVEANGFARMMAFVGRANQAGVRIVVGSHSDVPGATLGFAYQREMELLVESGMTPMQAIVAATLQNARFFGAEERLGSIDPGKLADLILVEGDPLTNISALRDVERVMLNGVWVTGT
jgi:imidazolonepropionase-like amidohydrolase